MAIFIYFCILILNVVAIFMTYKMLGEQIEKKEKLIFIIVGIAIMYVTVSAVYWLSTHNIAEAVSEQGKNFIVFTFVPVNAIIALPFLASSYKYLKIGKLKQNIFKNRVILICAIVAIVLILEFFYFKDIQSGILSIIQAK